MRTAHEPTYSYLILVIGLIAINSLLAYLSLALSPGGTQGVAVVYIAEAFMILFALWFGGYGVLAAYVGAFLGSLMTGMPAGASASLALADLFEALIPLVAVRMFYVDIGISDRRDIVYLVLFAVVLNNIVGAAWGALSLSISALIQPAQIMSVFLLWAGSGMVLSLVIVPAALFYLTPKIKKTRVFVQDYWN